MAQFVVEIPQASLEIVPKTPNIAIQVPDINSKELY
jgi:hypothetical protein